MFRSVYDCTDYEEPVYVDSVSSGTLTSASYTETRQAHGAMAEKASAALEALNLRKMNFNEHSRQGRDDVSEPVYTSGHSLLGQLY